MVYFLFVVGSLCLWARGTFLSRLYQLYLAHVMVILKLLHPDGNAVFYMSSELTVECKVKLFRWLVSVKTSPRTYMRLS